MFIFCIYFHLPTNYFFVSYKIPYSGEYVSANFKLHLNIFPFLLFYRVLFLVRTFEKPIVCLWCQTCWIMFQWMFPRTQFWIFRNLINTKLSVIFNNKIVIINTIFKIFIIRIFFYYYYGEKHKWSFSLFTQEMQIVIIFIINYLQNNYRPFCKSFIISVNKQTENSEKLFIPLMMRKSFVPFFFT